MKFDGTRSVLTLAVLGMAVFIGHRVVTQMQLQGQDTISVNLDEQEKSDAWIKGFSYRQTQSGATKWIVNADQAQVFDQEHVAKLENVQVQLFDDAFQKEQLRIISEKGVINTETNNFQLMSTKQQTVMTFDSGFQIFSRTLAWNEKTGEIHTPDPVTIQGDGVVITGTGLAGYVENEEFHLLENVRAEVW